MKKGLPLLFLCFFILTSGVLAQNSDLKPIVAVLDLKPVEVSESEAGAVTNLLISVIHGTDLVQIIDRNQREEILNEISFSLSGCADDSCALEIGKMLAADILITGSLSKVGSRISIELKALSIEEGSILETIFKLYESVDKVVDNIDAVGATLIQNVTGKRAAQREILEYEDLVTLTVTSESEDASVIINGTPIGRITDGQVSKALNKNIDVSIRLEHPQYYPTDYEVYLDTDKSVNIRMEACYPVKNAFKTTTGSGSMASFYYRWFPIPSTLFLDFGLGATLQNTNEFFIQTLLQFKSGYYFNNENNFIRPYAGLGFMLPFIDYLQAPDGGQIAFFNSEPSDNSELSSDGDSFLKNFDFGLLFGLDFALSDTFYLGAEADLFLNSIFQSANISFANLFKAPFDFTSSDPLWQFGINATFMVPPMYLTNHPDSIVAKGRKVIWQKKEYKPEFLSSHAHFISDLGSTPDLSDDVRIEIENWKTRETAGWIVGGISGAAAFGLGIWSIVDALVNERLNEPVTYTSAFSGALSLGVMLFYEFTPIPKKVINAYNQSLGGTE